jgi:transposase InsO family protein
LIEFLILKSKNASEIAEKIFDLICLISPFKCLHSDNGTEIKNKLMERLLEVSGINRRYGSSYSPRSLGLIESFNRILAESIRKCAEADSQNWPRYLNFVLLAYRTKVNEATKLSPYELVFARKPNHFENWTNTPSVNESNEIFNRAMEIKSFMKKLYLLLKIILKKLKKSKSKIKIREITWLSTDLQLEQQFILNQKYF